MPVTARIEKPDRTVHPDLTKQTFNGTNKPDAEETLFAIGQLDKAQKVIDDAKAAMKKLRSGLKLRGHSLEALDFNMSVRNQQDDTTADQFREQLRIARIMQLPYGFQMSFLDEQGAVQPPSTDLMAQAYADGRDRGIRGLNPDDQKWHPGTDEGREHMRGWNDGQAVNLAKIKDLETGLSEADKAAAKEKADKEAKKAAKEAEKKAKAEKKAAKGKKDAEKPADETKAEGPAVH